MRKKAEQIGTFREENIHNLLEADQKPKNGNIIGFKDERKPKPHYTAELLNFLGIAFTKGHKHVQIPLASMRF